MVDHHCRHRVNDTNGKVKKNKMASHERNAIRMMLNVAAAVISIDVRVRLITESGLSQLRNRGVVLPRHRAFLVMRRSTGLRLR